MALRRALHHLTATRGISSTPRLASDSWFDKIKSTLTGKKMEEFPDAGANMTLIQFADTMAMAKKMGTFKQFMSGQGSEGPILDTIERQSAVLRYLGAIDPTGEKLQASDKINASKHCNCTVADVEHTLAKFKWAKEAEKKLAKFKEEGKPLPNTFKEVQDLMKSAAVEARKSNPTNSDQISRNARCPCGSNKRYKRCCGAS